MAIERVQWHFQKDGDECTLDGIRSTELTDRSNRPKPALIFENSWNIPPLPDYEELLDGLDQHFAIFGLEKNGLNNLADREPKTVQGHADLTVAFCEFLVASGLASQFHLLGHSMGFATAYLAALRMRSRTLSLIGLAPLLPGEHSLTEFKLRFVKLGIGMGLLFTNGFAGLLYAWRSSLGYVRRYFRRRSHSDAIIEDMSRFRFSEPLPIPALMVVTYNDELVPTTRDMEARTREVLPSLTWHLESRYRHSMPLLHGRNLAMVVADYVRRLEMNSASVVNAASR